MFSLFLLSTVPPRVERRVEPGTVDSCGLLRGVETLAISMGIGAHDAIDEEERSFGPGLGLASGAAIGAVLALVAGGSPTVAFGLSSAQRSG